MDRLVTAVGDCPDQGHAQVSLALWHLTVDPLEEDLGAGDSRHISPIDPSRTAMSDADAGRDQYE